jgi:CRISPR-associated protein Cmr3
MANYKITLTPLDRFFFGGENVFGSEGNQDERQRSYLVQSNLLPQQTSLLGFLRQQLLIQNNLLCDSDSTVDHIQQAIDLVGPQGFSVKSTAGGYGAIKSISPVCLTSNGELWGAAPLDDCLFNDKPLQFSINEAGYPFLRNYDPKGGYLSLSFGNVAGDRKPLDDFFQKHEQVGIKMTNRKKHIGLTPEERQEGYYKQTYRTNTNSAYAAAHKKEENTTFSFVFFAEINLPSQYQFVDDLVNMGGERSSFRLEVTQLPEQQEFNEHLPKIGYSKGEIDPNIQSRFRRLVLLSDTYAQWPVISKHIVFSVAQTVPFRYFTTVLGKDTRYYDFKKNDVNTKQQSPSHTLLSKGSVLYIEGDTNLKEVQKELDAQTSFRQIGYNHYHII